MQLQKLFITVCATSLLAGTAQAQAYPTARPQLPADSLAIARKLTRWLLTSQADSVHAHMDSLSRTTMSVAEIQQTIDNFTSRAGEETEVMEEKWILRGGKTHYWYQSKFSLAPEPVVLRLVLDEKGQLIGLGRQLLSRAPAADPKPTN